jgi:hypothetical protein
LFISALEYVYGDGVMMFLELGVLGAGDAGSWELILISGILLRVY